MYKLVKVYLPGTAIMFTLVMLSNVIINALYGGFNDYHQMTLELLGFIILLEVLDKLISKVNFKTYRAYFITTFIVMYSVYLAVGYVFHWFDFNVVNLIVVTIPFTLIFIGMHCYYRYLSKKEAEQINKLLD